MRMRASERVWTCTCVGHAIPEREREAPRLSFILSSTPPQSFTHRLYRSKNQAWLTPVEIFAPHYSNAIARSVMCGCVGG